MNSKLITRKGFLIRVMRGIFYALYFTLIALSLEEFGRILSEEVFN